MCLILHVLVLSDQNIKILPERLHGGVEDEGGQGLDLGQGGGVLWYQRLLTFSPGECCVSWRTLNSAPHV